MIYCKKITIKNLHGTKPSIYLGLITGEDNFFIHFKTRTKNYTFAKTTILEMSDTNEEFE